MQRDKEDLAWRSVKKAGWLLALLVFLSPVIVVSLVYWLIWVIAEMA